LQCCEALAANSNHLEALAAAAAVADFLSYLRFGSKAAAAPYERIWRCMRDIITAASAALGAVAVPEEAVVSLFQSAARADAFLWATPWFGWRFAAALDLHLASCWASPEVRHSRG
jgi:hypothetical protein